MFVECYVPCRGTLLLEKKTGLCDTRTLRNISSFRVSYTAFLFSHASWFGHFPVFSVFCLDSSLFFSSYTPRRRCSRLKDCVLFEMKKKIWRVCSSHCDWPCSTQIPTCHMNYAIEIKHKVDQIVIALVLALFYLLQNRSYVELQAGSKFPRSSGTHVCHTTVRNLFLW